MIGVFVYYEDELNDIQKLESFSTYQEALAFVNKDPSLRYTVIEGHTLKLVPIEVVKAFKFEQRP